MRHSTFGDIPRSNIIFILSSNCGDALVLKWIKVFNWRLVNTIPYKEWEKYYVYIHLRDAILHVQPPAYICLSHAKQTTNSYHCVPCGLSDYAKNLNNVTGVCEWIFIDKDRIIGDPWHLECFHTSQLDCQSTDTGYSITSSGKNHIAITWCDIEKKCHVY